MITLACDTSSKTSSVALLDGDRLVAERMESGNAACSVTFMPMLLELLNSCGLTFRDIGLFACAVGPGSFTGLRIGVASVQAMAYASGRPAVGVSTLEALAWPLLDHNDAIICPVIDARNGRIYGQAFYGGDRHAIAEALPPAGQHTDLFLEALALLDNGRKLLFCGDAAEACASLAAARAGSERVLPPAHKALRAEWVGQAGLRAFSAAPADRFRPELLRPAYLGRSQAERSIGIDASAWTVPRLSQ